MQIDLISSVITLAILIMSIVIHEVAHGYAAYRLGDHTAEYEGRLTLNPLKHLDLVGSFIVPVILYMTGSGFMFGWAKPVPYNPYNLRDQRSGELKVALAGPVSNLLVALVFGLGVRALSGGEGLALLVADLCRLVVVMNIGLAIFNLVPIPPLDGSKVLYWFLPYRYYRVRQSLEQFGFLFVLLFAYYFSSAITPIITSVYGLFTGQRLS